MSEADDLVFERAVALFNRAEFFECHEVFEELWTPATQPERWFLQSLIHFAVGFYHHQRGNPVGASRQLTKGLRKIEPYLPEWGGIDTENIRRQVRLCLTTIESGGTVQRFPRLERLAPYRR